MPADSVRVHRLRAQDVAAQGLSADEAVMQLMHFIGSRPLVGYHLEFDLAMINRVLFSHAGHGACCSSASKCPASITTTSSASCQPAYQQQGNVNIDLRFSGRAMMRTWACRCADARDALNDAVAIGGAGVHQAAGAWTLMQVPQKLLVYLIALYAHLTGLMPISPVSRWLMTGQPQHGNMNSSLGSVAS